MCVRIPEDAAIDTKEKKRSLWGRFARRFIQDVIDQSFFYCSGNDML
jgi:hypothetical protein